PSPPFFVGVCKNQLFFSKSVLGIYLFEIKRVRRITSFWGNELATVLIAVVCIALLIWVTLYDRKNIKLN
ncbi:hypothetical protein, partial [Bacteroides sp.]|uniref:hypothetical protein n=1 Tax=Bacteroides sp. TaxID=29523 RepID=UPI00257E3F1C